MTIYTVQAGDNLTKIAKSLNTTVEELARKNNIKDTNKIFIGQKLALEETKQPEQPQTQQDLSEQLTTMQQEFNRTQEQMKLQLDEQHLSGWEIFGLGLGGAAALKGVEKVAPYAKSAAETGYLKCLYAKDAVKAGADKAGKATSKAVKHGAEVASDATRSGMSKLHNVVKGKIKHAAKKVELEYTFGKDAVKQGAKKIRNGVKHAAKKTELEYAFKKDAAKQIMKVGKAGKFLGRIATPLAVVLSVGEIRDAYKENGVKGAVKQSTKTGSGLACSAAGAKIGALIGACTGPAAPVAVPVLTAVGAIAGWIGGEKLADKAVEMFA